MRFKRLFSLPRDIFTCGQQDHAGAFRQVFRPSVTEAWLSMQAFENESYRFQIIQTSSFYNSVFLFFWLAVLDDLEIRKP